jgi:hypothetical protein
MIYKSWFVIIITSIFQLIESPKAPEDYLSIRDLTFKGKKFILSYSTHPEFNYYKQEYVPVDDQISQYHDMLFIDVLNENIPVSVAVETQIKQLNERKKIDAVTNYKAVKNPSTNEYLLDFIISDKEKDNELKVVEWNVYHYKSFSDNMGKKGVIMLAYSHREYGKMAVSFLKTLSTYRLKTLQIFSVYPVPDVKLKK